MTTIYASTLIEKAKLLDPCPRESSTLMAGLYNAWHLAETTSLSEAVEMFVANPSRFTRMPIPGQDKKGNVLWWKPRRMSDAIRVLSRVIAEGCTEEDDGVKKGDAVRAAELLEVELAYWNKQKKDDGGVVAAAAGPSASGGGRAADDDDDDDDEDEDEDVIVEEAPKPPRRSAPAVRVATVVEPRVVRHRHAQQQQPQQPQRYSVADELDALREQVASCTRAQVIMQQELDLLRLNEQITVHLREEVDALRGAFRKNALSNRSIPK